jgi:SsrA-binding protein
MEKILSENKKAKFDYEIIDTLEAGLMLTGAEVKSCKAGQINLQGSFVTFSANKAVLTNTNIAPYKQASNQGDYDPTRSRPLLLHKKEIAYLRGKSLEKGLTIVPLKVYTKNRLIKVEIGVGKGRHKYDKREVIKKRDLDREIKRTPLNT